MTPDDIDGLIRMLRELADNARRKGTLVWMRPAVAREVADALAEEKARADRSAGDPGAADQSRPRSSAFAIASSADDTPSLR